MIGTAIDLATEEDMMLLGAALAEILPASGLIFLHGPLGAGKTTLVRSILRAMGVTGAVKSPTYTLVESYAPADRCVHHFDLYRLSDPEELEFMGIRDFLDGRSLTLMEWPERGAGVLPEPDLRIWIGLNLEGRSLEFDPVTPLGDQIHQDVLKKFNKNFDKQ